MAPEPGLSTEELNQLALLGQLASSSVPQHQTTAITLAITHASGYREKASWDEIATALGITTAQLREWRSQVTSTTKTHDLKLPPPSRPVRPRSNLTVVLIVTGHPNAQHDQTNDFTTETAAIRERCDNRFIVKEIAGIALNRITRAIDDHEPDILHVAAHSDHGDVFLTDQATPVSVSRKVFTDAITRAPWAPILTVLNLCDSIDTAHRLASRGHTVVSWPGRVVDHQAREFAQVLYRELAAGRTLGTAFDDAEMTVARWPDLIKPHLMGDRSTRFR